MAGLVFIYGVYMTKTPKERHKIINTHTAKLIYMHNKLN